MYIVKGTKQTEGENKMTVAERRVMNAYKKDLMKQGIEKELAEVMAKVLVETGVIKPVVNSVK